MGLVPKIFDRLCAGSVGYSILISAYAKVGQMDGVLKLVNQIEKGQKGQCDILLFNTLLKVYCNVGYMDGVTAVLKKMDAEGCGPDRGTFNILLGYFAKEDLCGLALKTLEDMEARGHRPNEVAVLNNHTKTFLTLLQ
jgi:pentatricopeptide repeat protein